MVTNRCVAYVLMVGFCLTVAGVAVAQSERTKEEQKRDHDRYLIEAKHTPEECLKTLDELSAKSSKLLSKFDWGCMAGDHTGYAMVEAESDAAVKAMLPPSMQNAHIVKLNKFTPEQIKTFHATKK